MKVASGLMSAGSAMLRLQMGVACASPFACRASLKKLIRPEKNCHKAMFIKKKGVKELILSFNIDLPKTDIDFQT